MLQPSMHDSASTITFCGRRSRARRHPARLLAQSGEVKFGVQRVGERHPVEYRPRVEVLTQDYAHLPEAGDRPDLGIMVGEQVLPDAPQGLKHHVAGDWQEWECEHEALVLPPYCLCIRPGLELAQARAPEFGEDLRR